MAEIKNGHNRKQAIEKKRMKKRALPLLQQNMTTNEVAAELNLASSTMQLYRRELIREGRLKPVNYRNTKERHEFIKQNIDKPLAWFVERTRMAQSTLARDLKKLGRTDIKLNKYVTGKQSPIGSNEMLAREFRDCRKWNSVLRAMTTRKEMRA